MSLLRPFWSTAAALLLVLYACGGGRPAPPIALTGDSGAPWSLAAQRGNAVILTFGFTHCGDICPATMAKLARLLTKMGPNARRAELVMVTVDPQRDSPATLHRFVARFPAGDARVVGVTATAAQIDAVESAYHVWAQRIPGRSAHTGAYDIAHSAVIFFIDARGNIVGLHDDDDSDAVLSRAMDETAS